MVAVLKEVLVTSWMLMFGIIARFQLKDIMFGCSIQHAIFDGLNICSNCPGSFFYLKDYICMYMDPDVT